MTIKAWFGVHIKYIFVSFLILFFIFLNLPKITSFFADADQGAQLAKGMQILNGMHPFADIKGNIYGPLVFYLSAVGQMISGGRLIGEVLIVVAGYYLAYLLLFYLI